jgi:dienelactone hydrolase
MTKPLPTATTALRGHPKFLGFPYTPPMGGATHTVYWCGPQDRPGVLVMHELPGLTEETVGFAERLIAANYRVFLPLLFGDPMVSAPLENYERLCVMREFGRLQGNVTAPITNWLRALAADISSWCNDGNIGAVGMCLTGGFVIPLMLQPKVSAPVISQPSVPVPGIPRRAPLIRSAALRPQINVHPGDMDLAARAANDRDLTLVGFRFSSDWLCPRERFDTIKSKFQSRFEAHCFETPSEKYHLGKRAHSVLTGEYRANQPEDHPCRVATRRVLSFFAMTLDGKAPPGDSDGSSILEYDEPSP